MLSAPIVQSPAFPCAHELAVVAALNAMPAQNAVAATQPIGVSMDTTPSATSAPPAITCQWCVVQCQALPSHPHPPPLGAGGWTQPGVWPTPKRDAAAPVAQ